MPSTAPEILPQPSCLAIIPARAGSQRLPHKNKLPLAGKPLVTWTWEAALACPTITHTLLTSDDADILALAHTLAEQQPSLYPHQRESRFAEHHTSTVDTVLHCLEALPALTGRVPEEYQYLIVLQPTSPLRTAQHIHEALALAERTQADAVVSVTPLEHPSRWSFPLDGSHRLDRLIQSGQLQSPPPSEPEYRLNGAMYVVRMEAFLRQPTFFQPHHTLAYPMTAEASVDIDTLHDFNYAAYLLTHPTA